MPLGINYHIDNLVSEEESGDDSKAEKLTIRYITNGLSKLTILYSELIISFSMSLSVAYLLSTAKISVLQVTRPQRWLVLTIFTILPSSLEIYNLIHLATIGDVNAINVGMLA